MIDVYCHTSPSGKAYVGITSRGWRVRWLKHVWDAKHGSPLRFHAAIRKHGAESFKHRILERCETQEAAFAAELTWIDRLDSHRNGYNARRGGQGIQPLTPLQEERARYQGVTRPGVMGILAGLSRQKE